MHNQDAVMQYSGEGYTLGAWQVWPDYGVVQNDGHTVHVEPKVMALLMCLIRAEGRLVSRDVLLESVWADVVVNEEVLTRAVSELRTLLGDVGRPRRYIGTIPRKGYRLLMKAVPVEAEETPLVISRQHGSEHGVANDNYVRRHFEMSLPAGFGLAGRMVHQGAAATGYIILLLLLFALLNQTNCDSSHWSDPAVDNGRATLLHLQLIQPARLVNLLQQILATID